MTTLEKLEGYKVLNNIKYRILEYGVDVMLEYTLHEKTEEGYTRWYQKVFPSKEDAETFVASL